MPYQIHKQERVELINLGLTSPVITRDDTWRPKTPVIIYTNKYGETHAKAWGPFHIIPMRVIKGGRK